MLNKYVVYTALFGGYDTLLDVSTYTSPNVDYICFTDCDLDESKGWKIIKISNNNLTPAMNNRYYKLNPHIELSEYFCSLYIDANIKINSNMEEFFYKYSNNGGFMLPKHNERDCIYKEAKECIIQKKGNEKAIVKQIQRYKKEGMPKNYGLGENNILLRKHNDRQVIKLMSDWWKELLSESQRDQLSLSYVMWKNNVNFHFMNETCRNGNYYFSYQPHKRYLNRTFIDKIRDRIYLLIRRIKYLSWCP